ncbi:MAG: polyphosphate kinase 1 [Verrucomicrobiota bacterium]
MVKKRANAGNNWQAGMKAPVQPPDNNPRYFVNRELSWLEFNNRVLHEACDQRVPLLERIKFIGIFNSNLDEFFMKRVGGLKRQVSAGVTRVSLDGLTPQQQLKSIRGKIIPMLQTLSTCYTRIIKPELVQNRIHLMAWKDLKEHERRQMSDYFRSHLFPVLTPLAVDPGHPFPFISNLSTSLGVSLRYPDSDEVIFARVKIPETLPGWIRLKQSDSGDQYIFASLLDIIRHNLDILFPEMRILHVVPFRVTRNADIERDEEDADDLLEMIEQEIRQRRFEKVVRLEHGPCSDPDIIRFLMQELEVAADDMYEITSDVNFTPPAVIAALNLPALHYPPWTPLPAPDFSDIQADMFSVVRERDVLVHHPYDDFNTSVERFITEAADDRRVLAIKLMLYRIGSDSPFIGTLIRAAEAGKQVVCLVELKARFDEQLNIQWAQLMEKAGIHVVYGLIGLKTHAKIVLIVRNETDGLRCYAHIGTGNYNVQTAKLYTDFGLFTSRRDITQDLIELFNYVTGRSIKKEYLKLLVAPINMRECFVQMIEREIAFASAGKPARIIAKMNSLEDDIICAALYRASQAGVQIDLIVRGFCCLKPGIDGLSSNIRVLSVIGRFLEHSRIFYFSNGMEPPVAGNFFIGSADWMYRNLTARVEVVAPVENPAFKARLWETLQIMLKDERQAWEMQPDGSYVQRQPSSPECAAGTHDALMALRKRGP